MPLDALLTASRAYWQQYSSPLSYVLLLNDYRVFDDSLRRNQGRLNRDSFHVLRTIEAKAGEQCRQYRRDVIGGAILAGAGLAAFMGSLYAPRDAVDVLAIVGSSGGVIGLTHAMRGLSGYLNVSDIKHDVTSKLTTQ
jgi:hypothetical protein